MSLQSYAEKLAVVAIELGREDSTYVFVFKHEFQDGTLKKILSPKWTSGECKEVRHKVPTTLLLNPKLELVGFGYDAEDKCSDLKLLDLREYYYFEQPLTSLNVSTVSLNKLCTCT